MWSYASECSVLVLLDLSTTFDNMAHQKLINRLQQWIGIEVSSLNWCVSYLSNDLQLIITLFCGVPQGSVLRPLLLFMEKVIDEHVLLKLLLMKLPLFLL